MKAIIVMLLAASVNGRGTETKTPMVQLVEAVKNSDYTFAVQAGENVRYTYVYDTYFNCGIIGHEVYYVDSNHAAFLTMYHYVNEG